MSKTYQTIEQASRGATYQNDEDTFTVYQIGTYPRSSVLAGQQQRIFLDEFDSLAAAQKRYPHAIVSGSTYQEPGLAHLPGDEDPDPFGDNDGAWDY